MNLQPTLENDLVMIRPLKDDDLEPLYQVASDPKIWEQHPVKRYLRNEFEKFFTESMASKGALIVIDKSSDQIIGSSRFKNVEGFPNGVEIGWSFLGRDYWGGKYNQAVKTLMIDHAFKTVDYIIFYIAKTNIRSQKAVEKINGKLTDSEEFNGVLETNPDNLIFVIKKQN